ncbi:MAG: biopolymer transporter ExbD [Spirochaetaceae bacterium]|jgi:biopolymer transport protein ExbD|nr:biopolymer transporter ExbD [Spirochaetaceae bacterium]
MKIRRKKKRLFDNNSALSDLAFLLIIYFIVIAGFNINKGFLMDLPVKDSVRTLHKDDILRFELTDGGTLTFNGSFVTRNETEEKIASAARTRENLAVLLTVSPKAPWWSVVSFVELAKRLKIKSFSFKKMAQAGIGT